MKTISKGQAKAFIAHKSNHSHHAPSTVKLLVPGRKKVTINKKSKSPQTWGNLLFHYLKLPIS